MSKRIKKVGPAQYHVVHGKLFPPPGREDKWDLDLHLKDVDTAVKKWRFFPVYLNHKHDDGPFGWVSHMEKDPTDGGVLTTLVINSGIEQGKKALEGMENGTLTGFSFGQRSEFDQKTARVTKINPLEVSICTKGARPGDTNIYWFTDSNHKQRQSQFFKRKKMASELEAKKQQLLDELEKLKQEEAAAAQAGTTTMTVEQAQALLAQFQQLAPNGDLGLLAQTLQRGREAADQEAIRQQEEKKMKFASDIGTLRESGALGADPEAVQQMVDRIGEVPPMMVDAFADIASNFTKMQANIHAIQEQKRMADEQTAKLAAENAELQKKVRVQQTIAFSAPPAYVPVPQKPTTMVPLTPAAGVAPIPQNQPSGVVYRPPVTAGVAYAGPKTPSLFPEARQDAYIPPKGQTYQNQYIPTTPAPVQQVQQPIPQQQQEQAIMEQVAKNTMSMLANLPNPDLVSLEGTYKGNYDFKGGKKYAA